MAHLLPARSKELRTLVSLAAEGEGEGEGGHGGLNSVGLVDIADMLVERTVCAPTANFWRNSCACSERTLDTFAKIRQKSWPEKFASSAANPNLDADSSALEM